MDLPWTIAILAMSADGKIACSHGQPARFSSKKDLAHLESQIAGCDAVMLGAGTLRAYGTTLSVRNPRLLAQRRNRDLPSQPLQIVVSASGNLNPQLPFFSQPIPRCLLTTKGGAQSWRHLRGDSAAQFERILICEAEYSRIDWLSAFAQLSNLGYQKIAILGGGELVYSLLAENLIRELWLSVCPAIIGGVGAPTPVGGKNLSNFPSLKLMEVKRVDDEIFIHYLLQQSPVGE